MISIDAERAMRAVLARLEADAQRAEEAAPGVIGGAWSWVIGAESAAAGARELARQARNDADRFAARLAALLADPKATDADARRFLADAGHSYGSGAGETVERAAALLSPAAAVRETAAATAADLGLPTTAAGFVRTAKIAAVVLALAVGALVVRDARRAVRG